MAQKIKQIPRRPAPRVESTASSFPLQDSSNRHTRRMLCDAADQEPELTRRLRKGWRSALLAATIRGDAGMRLVLRARRSVAGNRPKRCWGELHDCRRGK